MCLWKRRSKWLKHCNFLFFWLTSRFDFADDNCKRSPKGLEYLGSTDVTESGEKCHPWVRAPGTAFPYGSETSNNNYCRTASPIDSLEPFMGRPWCYTVTGTPMPCNVSYCGKPQMIDGKVAIYMDHVHILSKNIWYATYMRCMNIV